MKNILREIENMKEHYQSYWDAKKILSETVIKISSNELLFIIDTSGRVMKTIETDTLEFMLDEQGRLLLIHEDLTTGRLELSGESVCTTDFWIKGTNDPYMSKIVISKNERYNYSITLYHNDPKRRKKLLKKIVLLFNAFMTQMVSKKKNI